MPRTRSGVFSVILVNFRGTDDTVEAVGRLRELEWPDDLLEIVVVENGSGDDSLTRLRQLEGIVLVESAENLGFAGGCDLGASRSTGEFLAFLNNDARPDPMWIAAAADVFAESEAIGAVASRVLDWEGKLVDYVGSAMTWFGQGYKPSTAEPYVPLGDVRRDVLFGTGSAMFVRRSVFDALGGFDRRFFMFFEDVDLGWRINLRGWRFVYEPRSLAFHKHHASMSSFGAHKEHYLLERNALFTLYKNAAADTLRDALPAAMGLAVRRGISRAGADSEGFDLRRGGSDSDRIEIGADAVAPLFAIDQFVEELPGLVNDREAIQGSRVVSDAAIWRLFGLADAPILPERSYVTGYENLTMAFDVTEAPRARCVLLITGDPIGAKLAGPAIRAWNMAEALAVDNDVALVSLSRVDRADAPFRLVHVMAGDDRRFRPLEQWADVIVFQGDAMSVFADLRKTDKIVVADIYDPMQLEQLEQARGLPAPDWARAVSDATAVLNEQIERADFLMAASERQRHFYLGQLSALGRLNTTSYDQDPDFRGLIDVVPFGLPATPPVHTRPVLKGVWPGIADDDTVLLWSGGLYNWFDPETLIRAVAALAHRRPGVRLFFQGTRHPHPGVPEMAVVARSRALAAELGVLDVNVFFNDSWVDYDDRQNYLLEASAGVSTHFEHIETTFSFRTRILDYLWAGLPMVVTAGDHFAELIEREQLGVVVAASDAPALEAALEKVLFDAAFRAGAVERIAKVRDDYRWDRVLKPLVDFVANAHPAPDRVLGGAPGTARRRRVRKSGIRHDLRRTWHYLRNGGPALVLRKVRNRIRP